MPTPLNFNAMRPSGEIVSPAVITSKAAQNDLLHIQTQHSDIVRGIAQQKARLDAYSQQKQSELAATDAVRAEMEREKMAYNSEARRDSMDFAQKQAEIDIKRSAMALK